MQATLARWRSNGLYQLTALFRRIADDLLAYAAGLERAQPGSQVQINPLCAPKAAAAVANIAVQNGGSRLSSGTRRNPRCVAGEQRVLARGRFGVGCVIEVAVGCPVPGIGDGVGLSGRFG